VKQTLFFNVLQKKGDSLVEKQPKTPKNSVELKSILG